MKDKRGMSQIITTVIIVVLVLVAIGIVWAVIANIIDAGSDDVALGTSCLGIQIKATRVVNTSATGDYDITLKRLAGGNSIGGVKILIKNDTDSALLDFGEALNELEEKRKPLSSTGILNANKVEVTVFILDASGNEKICQGTTSYSF